DPERISGGSSAGSAVVVALGIADFAIGTDTAGSGRVPAALNGIVGVKASIGLVPVDGVVPACAPYDCVTAFANDLASASTVMGVMTGPSSLDPMSRSWPADVRLAAPAVPRLAVPRDEDLSVLSAQARDRFDESVSMLRAAGASVDRIDLRPFLDAAAILYDGAVVAERYAAFGEFVEKNPDSADPTVAGITLGARDVGAAELARDQQKLRVFRRRTLDLLAGFDAMVLPTAPSHPTIAEVQAEPVRVNSFLGTYTNFLNILDMAAVAVPAGEADGGLFGVSIVVRAFEDQVALDIAGLLTGETLDKPYPGGGVPLAVFGAHLSGQPLNHQLVQAGARLAGPIATSSSYRMFALPGAVPKPGVVRVSAGDGVSLAGELWLLPPTGLGAFLADLPEPMTLGKVELSDGRWVTGFGCSDPAGEDISHYGGWLPYLG
ncbi:allophanate hydrolase, partial [Phytoactinopolyspora endophytica]|uniref:allophanate hydrolase n=1 Tax=Phytoactinopolyspora endophytica TaxID=1642495 RepID=UPI00197CA21A